MPTHDFGVLIGLAYRAFVEELHAHLATLGFTELRPGQIVVSMAVAAVVLQPSESSIADTWNGPKKVACTFSRISSANRAGSPARTAAPGR